MRKYVIAFIGVCVLLTGTVFAAEKVSFGFGTNFFKPSNSGFATSNGTNFELNWKIDDDVEFGIVNETSVLNYTDTAGTAVNGRLVISGIKITKQVMTGVGVGLGLGSGTATLTTAVTRPVVDVYGKATLLSRQGKNIAGSLETIISARYMDTNTLTGGIDAIADLHGVNAILQVKVGF